MLTSILSDESAESALTWALGDFMKSSSVDEHRRFTNFRLSLTLRSFFYTKIFTD